MYVIIVETWHTSLVELMKDLFIFSILKVIRQTFGRPASN